MSENKATRDTFGSTLLDLAKEDKKLVVVSCDLSSATRVKPFSEKYPDRFFEVGIAEQNGISVAAGLALTDLRPFIASFGAFLTARYDQIRTSCAYNQAGVVLVGTHSGLAIGKDGTTQMGLEDLNVLAAVPGMHIYQPADYVEAALITKHLASTNELAYLRLSRTPQPAVYDETHFFVPGKGHIVKEGRDLALIATGDTVYHCLQAANTLSSEGVDATVVNISTLKPFDKDLLVELAKTHAQFISVEDHNIIGSLGSRVAEVIAEESLPVRLTRHGVPDVFGESGSPDDLYRKYNLDAQGITELARSKALKPLSSSKPASAASPMISYHAVTWNRLDKLQNLLRSFMTTNQYNNFEWILIDHGSTDGTIDFLENMNSNPDYKPLWGKVKPLIFDEQEYIAELNNQGIQIVSNRRAAHAYYGYYRNLAREAASGDYFIDFPDDHQFIYPHDWVTDLLSIYNDRIQRMGRDDISSLVFKTRRLYRLHKKNNLTEPRAETESGVEYFVCRYKGYDDYGMISRQNFQQMGPYFQIDKVEDKSVIAAWNDPNNKYFNTAAVHYEHYLRKAKELGLKKIMTKYPITHDLMNDRGEVAGDQFAVPLTELETIKEKFGSLTRPVSFEEIENMLTGEPSDLELLKAKFTAKARTF